MKSQDEKQKFLELKAKGWSYDRIAKELKISKQTLVNWGASYREEIENAKAMELEAILEKFALSKEHRLSSFGETLERLRAEIRQRDLSDIPTDKLLEIYRKYNETLKGELKEEPQIKGEDQIASDKWFNNLSLS